MVASPPIEYAKSNYDAAWVRLASGNYHHISRLSKLTPQHVSRVLQGRRGVSLFTAKRIADAAAVSLDQLWAFIVAAPGFHVHGRKTRAEQTIAQKLRRERTERIRQRSTTLLKRGFSITPMPHVTRRG